MEIGKTLKLINEITSSPLFRTSEALKDLQEEVKDIAKAQGDRDQAVKEKAKLETELTELRATAKTVRASIGKLQQDHNQKEKQLLDEFAEFSKEQEQVKQRFLDTVAKQQEEAQAKADGEITAKKHELQDLADQLNHGKETLRQLADLKNGVQTEIDKLKVGLDQLRQHHFGG